MVVATGAGGRRLGGDCHGCETPERDRVPSAIIQIHYEQRMVGQATRAYGMIVSAAGHALREHGRGKGVIDPESPGRPAAPGTAEPGVLPPVAMLSPPEIHQPAPRQLREASARLEAVVFGKPYRYA
jgi:hypothetical protein